MTGTPSSRKRASGNSIESDRGRSGGDAVRPILASLRVFWRRPSPRRARAPRAKRARRCHYGSGPASAAGRPLSHAVIVRTPVYASWLNQVFLPIAQHKVVTPKNFTDL